MRAASSWRIIASALGVLWILDGLLQFQPRMFGTDFFTYILVPNLSDQPALLHAIVEFGISVWQLNPPAFNLLAGLLQIAIGVLLLSPLELSWFKTGAYISIAWGVIVWFCGEGAGLLLTGDASFYTGAPGAVTLYVFLAILILNREKLRLTLLPKIAGSIFILGAALQLQSVFWSVDGVENAAMAAMMEPAAMLKSFPAYISHILGIEPILANAILALLLLIMGIFLLVKSNRATGIVALILLFIIWWAGQDFGMLTSGIGTDPSTAPLVALFLVPLFRTNPSSPLHRA